MKKHLIAKVLLVAVLIFLLLPTTAFAATGTQDGLEVSLTTDKGSYTAGEAITVNVSIKNTNAFAVNNVKLDLVLPAGISLQSGSTSITIGTLAAGATETRSFAAKADMASPAPEPTSAAGGSPQTGDSSNLGLWGVLLVLSAGGLAGLVFFKKRKAAKFLSLFLCTVILTALVAPALPVQAATISKNFSVSEGVTVDGGGKTITVKVTYDWNEPPTQVTFTAAQTGGTSNTTDSTGIVLTFDQAVTGLTANDISITDGTGTVVAGTLSGSGTTWTIALTSVTAQGNVTVSVTDFGNYSISTGPRTVAVYMSNAVADTEAAKITNFATGTNTTSSLVFDPTITGGTLATGAVVNLVAVNVGADATTAAALNSSSITAAGVLSLNTQNTVDAADLAYVGVTFTVTINGVTSDPVTLDINSLFGATTTAGKLRTDKAKLTGRSNSVVIVTTVFTGDTQLDSPITMSPGVAMTETAARNTNLTGFKDVTIRADAGGAVTLNLITPAPFAGTTIYFTGIPFVCDNTTYTYTENFIVIVIAS